MADLKRGDLALLKRVLATNGGGVNSELVPAAQRERLIKLGLIRWKPCNLKHPTNRLTAMGQLIHTPKTASHTQEGENP